MPFVVSSPAPCQAFPQNCPYCGGTSPASTTVAQGYSKQTLSMIPGHVKTNTWKFALPSCQDCARWFRAARIGLFVSGAAAALLPIAVVLQPEAPAVLALWYASVGGYLGLLLWRRYRAQAFRIAYVGDREIVYAAREEAYASEFARQNNLSYQRRAIVMRLS